MHYCENKLCNFYFVPSVDGNRVISTRFPRLGAEAHFGDLHYDTPLRSIELFFFFSIQFLTFRCNGRQQPRNSDCKKSSVRKLCLNNQHTRSIRFKWISPALTFKRKICLLNCLETKVSNIKLFLFMHSIVIKYH